MIKYPHSLLYILENNQYNFVYSTNEDGTPSKIVAFLSPRDGGKTFGALLYGIYIILSFYNVAVRYIGPTYSQAKDVAIPVMEEIKKIFELNFLEFKIGSLQLINPYTNSILKIYGADNEKLHSRLRGTHNNQLIILDECQSWDTNLEHFITRILIHTLTTQGRIFMLGTPGDVANTFFHKATGGLISYINSIKAAPLSNKHTNHRVISRMELAKLNNPEVVNEPWYKREFLGEWVADNRLLEYNLNPKINYLTNLKDLYYELGCMITEGKKLCLIDR
jgi:hypothetical protein